MMYTKIIINICQNNWLIKKRIFLNNIAKNAKGAIKLDINFLKNGICLFLATNKYIKHKNADIKYTIKQKYK